MRYISLGLKFLVSGGVATGINLLVLYLLTEYVGWHYLASAVAAFIVAFCFSFSLQKFWTFKDKSTALLHRQMPLYLLASLAALVCNTALLFVFVEWLHLWYIAAEVVVAAIVAVGTFFVYRKFIFKETQADGTISDMCRDLFKKYGSIFLIFLAAACTVFFATYKLTDSPALWYDEGLYSGIAAYTSVHGTQAVQTGPNSFISTKEMTVGYPLIYPVALSYRLFGIGALQGRAVMAIYICLFVLAAYVLVRLMFGAAAGGWAALFLASFPMLYGNGKSVIGEIPGLFFLILTCISLLLLERSGYKRAMFYVLFGLSAGLCIATKPIFLLLLGALFITYLLRWKRIPLNVPGVALGAGAFLLATAVWAYLQFGPGISLHAVLTFYANPYSSANIGRLILQNAVRFVTESTPLYTLILMLVWAAALWIRRKKMEVSSAELSAFFFCILVLIAYLRLPGWYRYLFPALIVALIFLPQSLQTVYSSVTQKIRFLRPVSKYTFLPYVAVLLLAGGQLYQTAKSSYVAGYYTSTTTEHLSEVLSPLGTQSSFFLYNVPQVRVLLPSNNFYQYLPLTDTLILGKETLASLAAGVADYVVVDTDMYAQQKGQFLKYQHYATVDRYEILERIPNTAQK